MPRLGCGPHGTAQREPSWPRGLTEWGAAVAEEGQRAIGRQVCAACYHLPVGRLQRSDTRDMVPREGKEAGRTQVTARQELPSAHRAAHGQAKGRAGREAVSARPDRHAHCQVWPLDQWSRRGVQD